MVGSAIVYLGLILTAAGLVVTAKPIRWLRIPTRRRALAVAGAGALLAGIGLILPAPETLVARIESRLDEFVPVFQFNEVHTTRIAAPPARVYEATQRVRPDEIFLFRTLIAIRGGWQPLPKSVQDTIGKYESLHDIAVHSTFVVLADEAPRELLTGTIVGWPPGPREGRERLTPETFRKALPPGYAVAAMNYIVTPDGTGGSIVSTETRVFANSPAARRRFAVYWRLIYPGSALIRRMMLRALRQRATRSNAP